jgi:hypothetical protein
VALRLLWWKYVVSIVGLVFRYRSLQGQCDRGLGLDFDAIDELTGLEAMFRPTHGGASHDGRSHRREAVVLGAMLRGADLNDRVAVHDLSLGGAMISGAPYAEVGDVLEMVIDADQSSYRFKARVAWIEDHEDDYKLGLAWVGEPIVLNYGPASDVERVDVLQRFAKAA